MNRPRSIAAISITHAAISEGDRVFRHEAANLVEAARCRHATTGDQRHGPGPEPVDGHRGDAEAGALRIGPVTFAGASTATSTFWPLRIRTVSE